MKDYHKRLITILIVIVVSGCSTTSTSPSKTRGEIYPQQTITTYLPPVVVDLDYKDIPGLHNQVIVQGGFQHTLSVFDQKKAIDHTLPPKLSSLALTPVKDTPHSETETVLFESVSSSIPASERDKLNPLLHRIDSPGQTKDQPEGYTDSKGSAKTSIELSTRRTKFVRDYLVQHGSQPSKILMKDFGENLSLQSNDTEAHGTKNRRVETMPPTRH